MAEEFDFHPMWESLGMNLADHDMLLGAVGQMYGDMFLTQNNRPKSTSYLDFVATNIHSGRIKEMLDKKASGEAKKIHGVTVIGAKNIAALMPADTSALFSRNLFNFLSDTQRFFIFSVFQDCL